MDRCVKHNKKENTSTLKANPRLTVILMSTLPDLTRRISSTKQLIPEAPTRDQSIPERPTFEPPSLEPLVQTSPINEKGILGSHADWLKDRHIGILEFLRTSCRSPTVS